MANLNLQPQPLLGASEDNGSLYKRDPRLYDYDNPPRSNEFHSPRSTEWSDANKVLEALYLIPHYLDWKQTRWGSRHPDQFEERNPILGNSPSQGKVDAYFAITPILKYLLGNAIPNPERYGLQGAAIGLESATVHENRRQGVPTKLW
jgi:hypothetical protein